MSHGRVAVAGPIAIAADGAAGEAVIAAAAAITVAVDAGAAVTDATKHRS